MSLVREEPGEEIGSGEVTFTRAGLAAGFRRTIPVALSIFTYGLVFGVLSRQAGLSPLEALLMSGIVFAGASQFVAVGLWVAPLPWAAIILTTLVVNLRHLLMGASIAPWFRKLPPAKAYGSVFFLSDESWALTMTEFAKGSRNGAFLLGSGIAAFAGWVGATIVGQLAGTALQHPEDWGLDFAFTAVFVALLAGLWKGRRDILPWAVAAVVAIVASVWLPGKWYILLGGLAGSLTGAMQSER